MSADAEAEYPHEPLADGDTLAVGDARITALATPGHRPEHMAFLIADAGRGDTPWLAVTGDSLFVGDLARPDLAVEAEEGAHGLFRSLRRLLALDDFAEVWPGHIGGSLCGGAGMSQKPGSTIGFERRYNRLAKLEDEGEFVRALTGTLAPQPPNFTRIVALNRGPLLTSAATIETLAPARVKDLLDAGATLIDGRDPRAFDSDHVAGRDQRDDDPRRRRDAGRLGRRPRERRGRDRRDRRRGAPARAPARGGRLPLDPRAPRRRDAGVARRRTPDAHDPGARRSRAWPPGCAPATYASSTSATTTSGRRATSRARRTCPTTSCGTGSPTGSRRTAPSLAIACSVGNRSSIAASLLARAGVENIVHVTDGGVADLADEGIELVQG